MPKDYKAYNSRSKKSGKKRHSRKPLLWFSVFAVLVLVIFVGYWYIQHDKKFKFNKPTIKPTVKPVVNNKPQQPATPKIKFEFYNILTKQTVAVPNPDVTPSTTTPANTAQYIVQVASLKNAKVADSFRAKLALNGFAGQVKPVVNKSGNTWYRVQIGPFNNYDDASDTLNNLRKAHFDGMIKNIKN